MLENKACASVLLFLRRFGRVLQVLPRMLVVKRSEATLSVWPSHRFVGNRVAPLSGLSATGWAFKVDRVQHTNSLRQTVR